MNGVSEFANQRNCSICGSSFPDKDLIQYNDTQICPSCKPSFFQKLKEESATFSKCSICGTAFPESELIRYSNANICARCKPAFFQKLKEGTSLPVDMNYAGFWSRGAARFVDGIILWVINIVLYFTAGLQIFAVKRAPEEMKAVLLLSLIQYVIFFAYETFFIGKYGATPGKMALGVKVVNADGGSVGYAKAFGRLFAYFLSCFILCIGLIMAAFDDEKRALHDRICNTRVINTKK